MSPTAKVTRRGADRIRAGHPWIYQSDVTRVDAASGDLVRVLGDHARPIGWAYYSSTSLITLRMLTSESGDVDDGALIRSRLAAARAYRDSLGIAGSVWRLVNAEADHLPGMVIDRYGDGTNVYFVVQTLSQGADRRRQILVDWVKKVRWARDEAEIEFRVPLSGRGVNRQSEAPEIADYLLLTTKVKVA